MAVLLLPWNSNCWIETHPPTLLSLSQGWLKDADALRLKPWLGHACPCSSQGCARGTPLPHTPAWARLPPALPKPGHACLAPFQVSQGDNARVPWRQCNFQATREKKCAPFGFAGFFDVRVVWVQARSSATGLNTTVLAGQPCAMRSTSDADDQCDFFWASVCRWVSVWCPIFLPLWSSMDPKKL